MFPYIDTDCFNILNNMKNLSKLSKVNCKAGRHSL